MLGKKLIYVCSLIILMMAIFLLSWIEGINILTVITLLTFLIIFTYCLNNMRENIFFFIFILSFFCFIISGDLMSEYFNKEYYMVFSNEATNHSRIIVLTSLIVVFLSYLLFKFLNKNMKSRNVKKCSEDVSFSKREYIRRSSEILFYVTFSIYVFHNIEKAIYVLNYGYIESYLHFSSILPSIVVEFGDFSPICLFIYLATFPSKQECKLPIILFLLSGVIGLVAGSRGSFIYVAAFLFAYIFYRSSCDEVPWLKKRHIIITILLIPLIIVFLQLYEYIRVDTNIQQENIIDTFLDFFVNIGSGQKIIKAGYEMKDVFPINKLYSFGTIINYFKYGTLFNLTDLASIPPRHSIEFALESHSFSSALSFLTMKEQFLSGQGAGSCYMAELYHDFGFVGVVLGNVIYAYVFASLSNINSKKIYSTAILFYMFLNLLEAPRASFDSFLASIININFLIILFAIYIFSNTLRKDLKKKI